MTRRDENLKHCQCGRSSHMVNFCSDHTFKIACKCGVFVQHYNKEQLLKMWDKLNRRNTDLDPLDEKSLISHIEKLLKTCTSLDHIPLERREHAEYTIARVVGYSIAKNFAAKRSLSVERIEEILWNKLKYGPEKQDEALLNRIAQAIHDAAQSPERPVDANKMIRATTKREELDETKVLEFLDFWGYIQKNIPQCTDDDFIKISKAICAKFAHPPSPGISVELNETCIKCGKESKLVLCDGCDEKLTRRKAWDWLWRKVSR